MQGLDDVDRPGGVYFNPGAFDVPALIEKFGRRRNPAPSRIGGYPQIFGGPPATVFADDVLSDDPDRIRALVVVAGIGNGAATAIGWPLLASLVPAERIGVFAGLKAAADSIAIPLSVVVAAEVFLPRFGYRGIFAMLAVFTFIALAMLITLVRVPKPAELEVAAAPA